MYYVLGGDLARGLFNRKTDKFKCDDKEICCDATKDECCESNGGVTAGISITIIVVVVASVWGCYSAKTCCFARSAAMYMFQQPAMVMFPQPVVLMAPMVVVPPPPIVLFSTPVVASPMVGYPAGPPGCILTPRGHPGA